MSGTENNVIEQGSSHDSAAQGTQEPSLTIEGSPIAAGPEITLETLLADHAHDPDGAAIAPPPAPEGVIYNRDGSVRKKRGRKPGQKPAPQEAQEAVPENAPATTATVAAKMSSKQAANLFTGLTVHSAVILFGQEVGQASDEEGKMLAGAYKDYFDAKGGLDLPPEVGLIFAIGAFYAPRVMHEKSKTFREKVAGVFGRLFGRR